MYVCSTIFIVKLSMIERYIVGYVFVQNICLYDITVNRNIIIMFMSYKHIYTYYV